MKIAVIGAMEEEVTILRSKLEQTNREVIANCEFTSGFYERKEIDAFKVRHRQSQCSHEHDDSA